MLTDEFLTLVSDITWKAFFSETLWSLCLFCFVLFVAGVYSLLSIAGSACDNDVSDAGKDAIFEIDDAFLFVCLFVCFPVKKKCL